MTDERTQRLYALKAAAVEMADAGTDLGIEARATLPQATGLSPQGVAYALEHCLESTVSRSRLSGLCRQTPRVPAAHVSLAANVFVGAFRAIALALCQSPRVFVRASRRESVMPRLLHQGSGGAFELVEELTPAPGEHLWAYGSDETLRQLAATLAPGTRLHRHGAGLGAAVVRESPEVRQLDLREAMRALALDVAAFDQRGCLSPRLVVIQGNRGFAEDCCDHLVEALDEVEARLPRGPLTESERADAHWYEDTTHFVGSCVRAGRGLVFLDPVRERLILPPTGRYLHVTVAEDALGVLSPIKRKLTSVGFVNPGPLPGLMNEAWGPKRYVDVGQMQKPVFDGPVDLRAGWKSKTL